MRTAFLYQLNEDGFFKWVEWERLFHMNLSNSYWLTKEWIANCCLSNLDEKTSSLYRNSFFTILFTDLHLMIHRDSFENRDLRSSRRFFLLIKSSSSFVVIAIWSHQNCIYIIVLIDFSTISKINKYERNYLDLNKSSRLNDRRTTRREINKLMKNRRYKSSQINRCDSKSNRSCIKNAKMM
jgi:uncharacterized short protein YbdD (DUF466 family)